MTHITDLTLDESGTRMYVGWLDRSIQFEKAVPTPDFLERLSSLYDCRVRQTRGFFLCPFCTKPTFGMPVEIDGKAILLGSAEIEVRSDTGLTFVAPDLIYHYVACHHYDPPHDFIEAVLRSK